MFQQIACTYPVERPSDRPLRLAILGATGSIGRQTVDIVCNNAGLFEVVAVSTNSRVEDAIEICRRVHPRYLAVTDASNAQRARDLAAQHNINVEILAGAESMSQIATLDDVDLVVTATVGYSGMIPTIAAIEAGKDIALANKETLVVAGDLIRDLLAVHPVRIFPIDSEHSAIAQCLRGEDPATVERLIITASGGPFRTWDKARLSQAKAADALRHPNWDMGAKITIDSATMMNKAFEIIEAHYLYGLPADRIDAVVHPQSIVHSMVEFTDGAIKAQLGVPDMHLPIAYALGLNHRIAHASPRLSLSEMATLTFEKPDVDKFPCLEFARISLERGGNTACVINAANEIAVRAFLDGQIAFTSIHPLILAVLDHVHFIAKPQLDDYVETNRISRQLASRFIETQQF